MSSTMADSATARLRLASAQRKVAAFLEQIRHLEASDFPHDDAREALSLISEHFEDRLRSLQNLPASVNEVVVEKMCVQTALVLSRHTDILGFILRSTNVRNAFEIHFPLKRLVRKAVSEQTRLILSSEWNFAPFTYPMNLESLPDFILIGAPAAESGQALITPLAGHEIGHSIWRTPSLQAAVVSAATHALAQEIDKDPERRDRILKDLSAVRADGDHFKAWALEFVVRQLEEAFSDFVGLYVFGSSYLYAYEYFLAPGGLSRSVRYPSTRSRMEFLKVGAEILEIPVDPSVYLRWQDEKPRRPIDEEILAIADAAVEATIPTVRDLAFEHLRGRDICPPDPLAIARVRAAFDHHVPDDAGATLAEIVCAGWEYLRERNGLSGVTDKAEYAMLNELMLKTVEVSEFLLRVDDDA
ncbi:hypothetical protein [Brevundimonas diminuta]|uniref:hypothetical protein n=1 Tax=Brevundimonas diminuta TaxID=293 RepID=UPI003D9A65E5